MNPFALCELTLRIERTRGEAGQDADELARLAGVLERDLRAEAPDDPILADYARAVLEGYVNLARHGFFPEVRTGDEDL